MSEDGTGGRGHSPASAEGDTPLTAHTLPKCRRDQPRSRSLVHRAHDFGRWNAALQCCTTATLAELQMLDRPSIDASSSPRRRTSVSWPSFRRGKLAPRLRSLRRRLRERKRPTDRGIQGTGLADAFQEVNLVSSTAESVRSPQLTTMGIEGKRKAEALEACLERIGREGTSHAIDRETSACDVLALDGSSGR